MDTARSARMGGSGGPDLSWKPRTGTWGGR